jgi:hypothetical protein
VSCGASTEDDPRASCGSRRKILTTRPKYHGAFEYSQFGGGWKHLGNFLLCVSEYTIFLRRRHFVTVRCDVNHISCFVETMIALHLHKALWEQREHVVSNFATRVQVVTIQRCRKQWFNGLQKGRLEEVFGFGIEVLVIQRVHGIQVNAKASSFAQLFGHLRKLCYARTSVESKTALQAVR